MADDALVSALKQDGGGDGRPPTVQSVERALDILLYLASHEEAGPTGIAADLKVHKSTAHRILRTLASRGFTTQDAKSDRYRLGPAAQRLSRSGGSEHVLAHICASELRRLQEMSGETALVNVRAGISRVCVAQIESPQEIRRAQPLGQPLEIYAGAMGKVLLMDETPDQLERLAEFLSFEPLTKSTPPSMEVLCAQLHRVHMDGYSISVGERVRGATTVAVPMRDMTHTLVGALAISGPTFRFSVSRARTLVPQLTAAAARLTTRL